jgi:hypothetical protein
MTFSFSSTMLLALFEALLRCTEIDSSMSTAVMAKSVLSLNCILKVFGFESF